MSDTAQALGLKLKAEREKRGVSLQKMANDMHLDDWVIEALEAGDYERIGPPVYAKGHLRKYASILGISPDGTEVAKPARSGPAPPVPIIRMDPPANDVSWPKVGGIAVIVLVAGGIAWWRPWHRSPPAPLAASISPAESNAEAPQVASQDMRGASTAEEEQETLAAPVSAASAAPPPSAAPTPSPALRVSAPAPGAAESSSVAEASAAKPTSAAPAPDLTPGVGRARLRLSFSADSRVDVYDYSGKAVFTGNGRANSVKTIAGMAPFRVYLGFASGVQLQVNDRAVAIGPQFVSGDVARFEAGADGVLRRDARPNPTNGSPNGAPTVAASPRG